MDFRSYTDLILPKASNIAFCIITVILLWSGLFESTSEVLPVENLLLGDSPLAYLLAHNFNFLSIPAIVLSAIILMLVAFSMVWINEIYSFIAVRTILPAFIFIVISSLALRPHSFSIALIIVLLFAIITFFSFKLYECSQREITIGVFNIGILLGIATLFSHSCIFYTLVLFLLFYQQKTLSFRTFIAYLMGISIPLLYTTLIYVATDNTYYWTNYLTSWFSDAPSLWTQLNQNTLLYLCVISAITVFAIVKVFFLRSHQSIRNREETMFLLYMLILTVLLLCLGITSDALLLPLFFFFSSFLIGQAFSSDFSLSTKIGWGIFLLSSIAFMLFPDYKWSL